MRVFYCKTLHTYTERAAGKWREYPRVTVASRKLGELCRLQSHTISKHERIGLAGVLRYSFVAIARRSPASRSSAPRTCAEYLANLLHE